MNELTPAIRELMDLHIWAAWRMEPPAPGRKDAKIPYSPVTRRRAESDDPRTCGTYQQAREMLAAGWYDGLSILLTPPLIGIDLDHCREKQTGTIHPDAQAIVHTMDTYAEVSPGLGGVKMIGRGKFPSIKGKNYRNGPAVTWPGGGIEYYGFRRFWTITFHQVEGTPDTIEDVTEPLGAMHRHLYPPRPKVERPTGEIQNVSDAAKLKRCLAYLAKMPDAVSGRGGHDRTFAAACTILKFGVSETDARAALEWFNANKTGVDPWSEGELDHKLSDAYREIGSDFGCMLRAETPRPTKRKARRFTFDSDAQNHSGNIPGTASEFSTRRKAGVA